jgi:DNA anti-recombination protein RmuC
MMQQDKTTCKRLRKLHGRLTEEIRLLKEGLREAEQETFENPIETVNVIKNLQEVLNTINHEIAKCPAEDE